MNRARAEDDTLHAGADSNIIGVGEGDNDINSGVNQGNFRISVGNRIIEFGGSSNTFLSVVSNGKALAIVNDFQMSTLDETSLTIVLDVSKSDKALALI